MAAIVYINGNYLSAENATVSVFDRGVLFGDSVYEVIPVYNWRPFFADRHMERLKSNLEKIGIPIPETDWQTIFQTLIERNGGGNLQLYLQITRGNQGMRKHDFSDDIKPTVIAFTIHNPYPDEAEKRRGLDARLATDYRWLRCDIKTTAMLGNILLHDEAISAGAQTALLIRDGFLTEGSSNNVFVVHADGIIKTPPLDNLCLPGITRQITIEIINALGLPFRDEPVAAADIFNCREIMITSTTKEIFPVTRVDQKKIGEGYGGPVWEQLHHRFQQLVSSGHV